MAATVGVAVALSRTPPPVSATCPPGSLSPARLLLGFDLPPAPDVVNLLWGEARIDGFWLVVVALLAALYLSGLRVMRRSGDEWSVAPHGELVRRRPAPAARDADRARDVLPRDVQRPHGAAHAARHAGADLPRARRAVHAGAAHPAAQPRSARPARVAHRGAALADRRVPREPDRRVDRLPRGLLRPLLHPALRLAHAEPLGPHRDERLLRAVGLPVLLGAHRRGPGAEASAVPRPDDRDDHRDAAALVLRHLDDDDDDGDGRGLLRRAAAAVRDRPARRPAPRCVDRLGVRRRADAHRDDRDVRPVGARRRARGAALGPARRSGRRRRARAPTSWRTTTPTSRRWRSGAPKR